MLLDTEQEIPYATVMVEQYDDEPKLTRIAAAIYCERESQKPIVVGRAGHRIRELGIAARQALAEAFARPVHLNLFVKVVEAWSSAQRELHKLGYTGDR